MVLNTKYYFYIMLLLCVTFSIIFLFIILFTYIVFKILQLSIEKYNIFFYKYNKTSQQIIDKYGNFPISNVYLIRHPFSNTITMMINILTLYDYNKQIKNEPENCPYHTLVVFEIRMENNMKKLILLEKNNCINLTENFFMNNKMDIKRINLSKKNKTINQVLKSTLDRIGPKVFFNWDLSRNNCQKFIKEILITINKCSNKNKTFIFTDKISKTYVLSEFSWHVIHFVCILYNIIETYVNYLIC